MEIRALTDTDIEPVVELWQQAGLTRPWNDPHKDIERARAVYPELVLVAADADALIGSVIAGYDGHRGWLYYLATAADRRGEGIGRALVAEAELRLLRLGCPKVQLMVRSTNADVLGFYDSLGYERSDVIVSGKRLIEDA
ncbi:acetyltransferase YpeA [Microbacterium sorbitolivorans]|uniref:GNAT family acetyltransferase n=1 Tax=Microbacterium sorbitolivorans TaxID=1867410 RepID=A0A367Y854_9MICO|nr:GNAT family acetyltransferase [Microbacterium sorbitolivorans]RCK61997.1 GNAT family acetyltransferase [Microbacterium sorbitolivorans]GGF43997.1 acetyltransferase YpeA [Microbacterium sorbitolivorans]